jgi:hypothetical protein
MVIDTMVLSKMIKSMDMVCTLMQMEGNIWVIGRTMKWMVKVFCDGQVGALIAEHSRMEKDMVGEN